MKIRKGFFDDIEEPESLEKETGAEECIANKDVPADFKTSSKELKEDSGENAAAESSRVDLEEESDTQESKKCGCKKRNVAVFSGLATVLCAFVFVSVAYALGLFNGKYTEAPDGEDGIPKEEFYYYSADYKTDIFTIPEYLALDRSVKYSPDSSQSYLIKDGDYASEGEPGLVIIGQYLNAVIAGDHEKVNSLYTEKYVEENGKHAAFPPQKLFKIRIKNERLMEEKDGYTVYYFTVSYRIFKNDGLFRLSVDENRERAQIFEVFVYGDGSGKINLVKDRPGYVLDI